MSELSYLDYKVDEILSTQKNPNKKNICKIKSKYYFQIPNTLEDNLEDENNEQDYYHSDIEITEDGDKVRIVHLYDLFNLCVFFQINEELIYTLVFQHLNFVQMSDDFVIHFQSDNIKNKVLDCIQEHGLQIVYNSIDSQIKNQNKAIFIRKTINHEFSKHYLIHPSILSACFHPVDLWRLENLILNGEGNKITKEEEILFLDWIYLLEYRVIQHKTIFNKQYDLGIEDIWTAADVQQYLDQSIDQREIDPTMLEIVTNRNKGGKVGSLSIDYYYNQSQIIDREIGNILQTIRSERTLQQEECQKQDCTNDSIPNLEEEQEINEKILNKMRGYFSNLIREETNDLGYSTNVPSIQTTFEGKNQKVYVEMRLKEKQKYRLATRQQSIQSFHYLFKTDQLPKMQYTPYLIKRLQERMQSIPNLTLVYLDMKDFNLNIDYTIVEQAFKLPDLAEYLRQRQVVYIDPISKKEEQLYMKRGIIIGEPFHDLIAKKMSFLIRDTLISILSSLSNGNRLPHHFKVHNYMDDFLLEMPLPKIDETSLIELLQWLLKEISKVLRKIGVILNTKKVKIYHQSNSKKKAWIIKENFALEQCNDFILFNKNLMDTNEQAKQYEANQLLETYILKLINDINVQNKNYLIILAQYSQLEKLFIIKFIRKYLKRVQSSNSIQQILSEFVSQLEKDLKIEDPFWFLSNPSNGYY